jgi:hypothetical protein
MPPRNKNRRYKVNVCRIAYSNLDIEVWATSQKDALRKAEAQAGNHVFPNEHSSEYEAQGASLVVDDPHLKALMNKPGSVAEAKEDGFTRSFR